MQKCYKEELENMDYNWLAVYYARAIKARVFYGKKYYE